MVRTIKFKKCSIENYFTCDNDFLFEFVAYGFIFYTIFIFVVYLKYTKHTTIWKIIKFWFCRFMYGESSGYSKSMYFASLNYFKLKLLCLIVGARMIFINFLNEYLVFHGYSSAVSCGLVIILLRVFIAFIVDLVHVQVILDFVCYLFGLSRLDLFSFCGCSDGISKFDESAMGLGRFGERIIVPHSNNINLKKVFATPRHKYPLFSNSGLRYYSIKNRTGVPIDSIIKSHSELVERLENVPGNPWRKNIAELVESQSVEKFWISNSSLDFCLYVKYVDLINKMFLIYTSPYEAAKPIMQDRGLHIDTLNKLHKKSVSLGGPEFRYVQGFSGQDLISPINKYIKAGSDAVVNFSTSGYSDIKNTIIFDKLNCDKSGAYFYNEMSRFLIKGINQTNESLVRLAAFDYKCGHRSVESYISVDIMEASRFKAREIMGLPTDFIHPYGDNVLTHRLGGTEVSVLIEDKYRKISEILGRTDVGVLSKFTLPDVFYTREKFGNHLERINGTIGAYHFEVLDPHVIRIMGIDECGIYDGRNDFRNCIDESKFYEVVESLVRAFNGSGFSEYGICGTNPSERMFVPDLKDFPIKADIISESDYAFIVRVNEVDLANFFFDLAEELRRNHVIDKKDLTYVGDYARRIGRVEEICSKEFDGKFSLTRYFTAYKKI